MLGTVEQRECPGLRARYREREGLGSRWSENSQTLRGARSNRKTLVGRPVRSLRVRSLEGVSNVTPRGMIIHDYRDKLWDLVVWTESGL